MLNALAIVLMPLVRILVRSGVSSKVAADVLHRTFVKAVEDHFALPNKKLSDSRISVLTGLTRKQVAAYRRAPEDRLGGVSTRNRVERVITAWLREKEYLDEIGDPRHLPLNGRPSMTSLITDFAGDVPVRSVIDELLRIKNIAEMDNGDYRLLVRGYLPSPLSKESLGVFGRHAADFLSTMENNLAARDRSDLRFQAEVSYNNIPVEFIDEFKELSARLSHRLLEDLDRWLAEKQTESEDTDSVRLGLGAYVVVAPNEVTDDEDEK